MKIIKSVSLNDKNEKDQLILKAIKRRNFSGFAKKCILEHLERIEKEKKAPQKAEQQNASKPKLYNQSRLLK